MQFNVVLMRKRRSSDQPISIKSTQHNVFFWGLKSFLIMYKKSICEFLWAAGHTGGGAGGGLATQERPPPTTTTDPSLRLDLLCF